MAEAEYRTEGEYRTEAEYRTEGEVDNKLKVQECGYMKSLSLSGS